MSKSILTLAFVLTLGLFSFSANAVIAFLAFSLSEKLIYPKLVLYTFSGFFYIVCLNKSEKKGILDALLLKHGHLIL